jgi:hypothetical protein
MTGPPKGKHAPTDAPAAAAAAPARAATDRTSTVVTGTLILLTVIGVLSVFWEPLAALAQGGSTGPAAESAGEPRVTAPDAGSAPASIATVDASGSS